MAGRFIGLAIAVVMCVGCGIRASSDPSASASSRGTAVNLGPACTATDQDQYVYRPVRLRVIMPCVHLTGTVVTSSAEADGDIHLDVRLDASYEGLLNPGNLQAGGSLVVEPVCRFPPVQAEAIRVCASDPDPYANALPAVGEHVWLEGRYVLDLQHHAWAELHPLYRWGIVDR